MSVYNYIKQPAKDIPIKAEYDVIVVGGGIGGIAAALAAKRSGAKTLLIEKTFMLGGLATAGLITYYLPLCDGDGNQVSFGIAEELLRLSIRHGKEERDDVEIWLDKNGDKQKRKEIRFQTRFNANLFAILCERLLLDEKVDILYGTSVCDVAQSDGRIHAVFTENKSGRTAYKGKTFIDATGDADLCALSGESTRIFQQGNVLAYWYYECYQNKYRLRALGFADIPDKYKTEERKTNDTRKRYVGLDGEELSTMTCDAHKGILEDFLSKGGIDDTHALGTIATIPQVRMTRCLDGEYTVNDEEKYKYFPDSIGVIADWRKSGAVYEIPFRCLRGNIKNLLVCGRCISVTDDMWDITRVIPVCAVTGQAVGTAAAITDDFSTLDIVSLQNKLRNDKVKIHIEE